MKRIILYALIIAMLVLAACQTTNTDPQTDVVPTNSSSVESQETAEETIRLFFEGFNNRDSDAVNALMAEGSSMTLTEEEAAKLILKSCTELQSDESAALVEAVFDVKLDGRKQSSFDEGEYTWRFELVKSSDGVWRITNYGM